jgi:hypothetical protein
MSLTLVTKASGVREPWNREKLARSLASAGADDALTEQIIRHVEKDLSEGMRTGDIYRHAFAVLKKERRPVAAQYSLKRALAEFGPSGFPFERFIGTLLSASGYKTSVGIEVAGFCVSHEVDVVAENDEERILVEAKFHNSPDIRSDVKVALYVKARFDDVIKKYEYAEGKNGKFNRAWLITNTNFTSQAIKYGTCAGLLMTGWNYPQGSTLQDIVRRTGVHPLTVLTTLTSGQKVALIGEGAIVASDIAKNPTILRRANIPLSKHGAILNEIKNLQAVTA